MRLSSVKEMGQWQNVTHTQRGIQRWAFLRRCVTRHHPSIVARNKSYWSSWGAPKLKRVAVSRPCAHLKHAHASQVNEIIFPAELFFSPVSQNAFYFCLSREIEGAAMALTCGLSHTTVHLSRTSRPPLSAIYASAFFDPVFSLICSSKIEFHEMSLIYIIAL